MNNDKDRKAQSKSGTGRPGVNPSAELQAKQNTDLHRDATKEMHDQLAGASSSDQKGNKTAKGQAARKQGK